MTFKELQSLVSVSCREQGVHRLDLFGSHAESKAHQDSDYDFLAVFEETSPALYAKRYFHLLHDLEDRLGKPVDLLTPDSIKRDSLRRQINRQKVCLYES